MGSPGTREQQAQETRRKIIEATARILRTEGLAATTTRRIAREVGCADGTLYVHFHNRIDLLLAVLEETIPAFLEPMRTLRSRVGRRTVAANLSDAAGAALALYDNGGPVWAALFAEPEILAAFREELRRRGFGPHVPRTAIADYVVEEQRRGRIAASVNPNALAGALLGASFQRAFASHFLGESRTTDEDRRFVRDLTATILEPAYPSRTKRSGGRTTSPEQARALDPAGDDSSGIKSARDRAIQAIRRAAGKPTEP
jgi:AcrR family transcriptional regulator